MRESVDEKALMRWLFMQRQPFEVDGMVSEWRSPDFGIPFLLIDWGKKSKELASLCKQPIFEDQAQEDQFWSELRRNDKIGDKFNQRSVKERYGLIINNTPPTTKSFEPLSKAALEKWSTYFAKPELRSNLLQNWENYSETPRSKYSVTLYFPLQFEALRIGLGYKSKEFIRSLTESHKWASSGGQSKSEFYKSDNGRFISKSISQTEFEMFKENAGSYFKYVFNSLLNKQESFLSRVLSLAEVLYKGEKKYFIVLEGVNYGLPGDEQRTYDLKGSLKNRLKTGGLRSKTGLDTNFLIERNGDPIYLEVGKEMDFFATLERDVNYLRQRDIVDYSLLVVINRKTNAIKVGIIDYLRRYDWKKMIENKFKKISYFGQDPTIVNPNQYADRFLLFMRKCFISRANAALP